MPRLVLRARLLDLCADPGERADALRYQPDGALVLDEGRIVHRVDWPSYATLAKPGDRVIDRSDCLIAPGFIDAHIHLPQMDAIAAPAAGLLPWLQQHVFPAEQAFADPAHCERAAAFFLDQMLVNGTTSAAVLGSVHARSVDALFEQAQMRGMRLAAGKCLMDSNCPAPLQESAEEGMAQTLLLLERWHGRGRLSYAVTPRYAGSSSLRQLTLAGELVRTRPDLPVQTHLAENRDEVRWIGQLFPEARSYLDVYERAGLLCERTLLAHCLHLDSTDRSHIAQTRSVAVCCPSSNLFLGSGLFDFAAARRTGMRVALATDVGAGQSYCMLSAMRSAHEVGRLQGQSLGAAQLWYWATLAGAQALGWDGQVGRLDPGMEADLVVLDPSATPLLARRCARADSAEQLLFALIVLGDDRAVRETYVAGRQSKPAVPAVADPTRVRQPDRHAT
jgi:guanine deaminase